MVPALSPRTVSRTSRQKETWQQALTPTSADLLPGLAHEVDTAAVVGGHKGPTENAWPTTTARVVASKSYSSTKTSSNTGNSGKNPYSIKSIH